MSKLRLAVLGAGHLGMIHARLSQQHAEVELVGVVDPQPAARARVREQLGVAVAADLAELTAPIDAAIIAAPSSLHYELAQPLLARGVHLLIEKPVTVELQQALILARLAARFECTVAVGHVERFNPAWAGVAEQIGRLRYFEAHRLSNYSFRSTDVGAVLDLMIHDLDLLASLTRSTVEQVEAWGTRWLSADEDLASARLRFECGAVGQLTASRCHPEPQRRLWLVGERGEAVVDLHTRRVDAVERTPAAEQLRRRSLDLTPAECQAARENMFSEILPRTQQEFEAGNAILAEQQDWLAAIRTRRPPRVDLPTACRSLSWAEKICAAIHAGEVLQAKREWTRRRTAA